MLGLSSLSLFARTVGSDVQNSWLTSNSPHPQAAPGGPGSQTRPLPAPPRSASLARGASPPQPAFIPCFLSTPLKILNLSQPREHGMSQRHSILKGFDDWDHFLGFVCPDSHLTQGLSEGLHPLPSHGLNMSKGILIPM